MSILTVHQVHVAILLSPAVILPKEIESYYLVVDENNPRYFIIL